MSSFTLLGKGILAAVALVLIGIGAWWYASKGTPAPVACTMEAKLCPDGSAVGRTGPNCEFAPCPIATSTATTTATSTSTTTSGSGAGGGGILPYHSGIRGTVMMGPTCPVERNPPDPACAEKPFKTLVSIFRTSDLVHAVVLTQSDAKGAFEASLSPGNYTVGAGEAMLPRCTQTPATVAPNTYTTIVVECDTGIR